LASSSFDFRSLKKYLNPRATDDLNRFLENVPQHAGHGVLIAAGIAWGMAAAFGLFTMMQAKQLTELREKLQASEALKPVVPTITRVAVSKEELKAMIDALKAVYPRMTINENGGKVTLQSRDTASYTEFREALGHVVNGGNGWKIGVENFCVGRECQQNALDAGLKVEKLKIDKPVPTETQETEKLEIDKPSS
jgi:hypothetical protein